MKPANEIEIKRNVYTFSAIVLVLSVLIGTSAWTVLGNGNRRTMIQLNNARKDGVRLRSQIDSLEQDTARKGIKHRECLKEKEQLLGDPSGTKLRVDLNALVSHITNAKAADGPKGRDLFWKSEPSWPDHERQPDELANRVLQAFNGFYVTFDNQMGNSEERYAELKAKKCPECPSAGGSCDEAVNKAIDQYKGEQQIPQNRELSSIKLKYEQVRANLRKSPTMGTAILGKQQGAIALRTKECSLGSKTKADQMLEQFKKLCVCIESGQCD